MDNAPISAEFILDVIEKSLPTKEWAFFRELRIGTGYGKDSEQRFDAWAINYYPSKRNVSRCYEVKISRSDFLSELKKPKKRRHGLRLANEFYFVTPKGMVTIEEVPPECGLIEVGESGSTSITIKAPFRDIMPPTWLFVSSLCRRLDRTRTEMVHAASLERLKIRMSEVATSMALDNFIKRWRDHSVGSREVPDKIVEVLEDLKREVLSIISHQNNN